MNQMNLYTETTGQGADVVLLHGWGLHSGVWGGVTEAFRSDYRFTCIDLPGHGRSRGGVELADLNMVCTALRSVAPARAVWIGWSLGGLIALAYALWNPTAVSRVVSVASTPRFTKARDWPHALPEENLQAFGDNLERDHQGTLQQFLALQMQGGEAGRASIRYLRAMISAHPPRLEGLWAGLKLLRTADLRPRLFELFCPFRMILGERDALVPAGCGADTVRGMRDGHYAVLRDAAHAPFLSHPAGFAAQLQEYLHD